MALLGVVCVGGGGRLVPSWVARAPCGQEVLVGPLLGQVWLTAVEEPSLGMGGLLGLQRWLLAMNVLGGGFLARYRPAAPVGPSTHGGSWLPGPCNVGLSSVCVLNPFLHPACHFEVLLIGHQLSF